MDSSRSRGLQSSPVVAWRPADNNGDRPARSAASRLSAGCVQGLVLAPLRQRVARVALAASFVISATRPQGQDSLTRVALCLPTPLPKRNVIKGPVICMWIDGIYLTGMYLIIYLHTRLHYLLCVFLFGSTYFVSILQCIILKCRAIVKYIGGGIICLIRLKRADFCYCLEMYHPLIECSFCSICVYLFIPVCQYIALVFIQSTLGNPLVGAADTCLNATPH